MAFRCGEIGRARFKILEETWFLTGFYLLRPLMILEKQMLAKKAIQDVDY
jgi:hypothetical protein